MQWKPRRKLDYDGVVRKERLERTAGLRAKDLNAEASNT
jgi:hypothetical protein